VILVFCIIIAVNCVCVSSQHVIFVSFELMHVSSVMTMLSAHFSFWQCMLSFGSFSALLISLSGLLLIGSSVPVGSKEVMALCNAAVFSSRLPFISRERKRACYTSANRIPLRHTHLVWSVALLSCLPCCNWCNSIHCIQVLFATRYQKIGFKHS
jgi:hypothetical protein